jgi:PAS domain S-box-containing protein
MTDHALVRLFADGLPAMVFIADAGGMCTFTNARFREYTGMSEEALYGTGWVNTLHPDDARQIPEQWISAVTQGVPYEADSRFRRHDGAFRWHAVRGGPVRNAEGAITAWIGACFDIEEHREATAILDAVLDAAPIGIGFWDRDFRFRRLNARLAEMNGLTPEAYIGKRPDEILPDIENIGELYAGWRDILATGIPLLNVEVRGKTHATPEGDRIWREDFFPVRLEREIIGIGAVVEDVTQRKQAEIERREADQRKDQFLATLAHELRNPLAPLRIAVDALRLADKGAAPAPRLLEVMDRQLNHLSRLVDDLLDVSRITRGKVQLRLETCDARDVIAQSVENAVAGETAHRQYHLHLPDAPLMIQCDPVRIAQVLDNLLGNAGKFTREDGHIWITAERTVNTARIFVRDDGGGMDADLLGEIFDLFRQGDDARGGGLGIGLTLTRSLLELHGGTIEARSPGRGKGSEFIVNLPLAQVQAAIAFPPDDGLPLTAIAGRRLLVVDDKEDVTESMAALLCAAGAIVRVANDGLSALELVRDFQPDAALLDISMPGMDGYELARAIRARHPGNGLVLVAVTGWGQAADKARAMAAGFDLHLTKPIGLSTLRQVTDKLNPGARPAD